MEFALTNWTDILSIIMAFIMPCLIYKLCSRLATRRPNRKSVESQTENTTVSVSSQTGTVRDPLALPLSPPTPIATSYDQVTIEDVKEILNALRKHHFPASEYYMLGIQLGLYDDTLTNIREDNQESKMCLNKCLCTWLMQADKNCRPPTWNSLITSLGMMGLNAVASGIDKEKHQACAIFDDKKSDIEKLLDEQAVRNFVKKEILKDEVADQDLLQRMKDTICAGHEELKKFAFILQLLHKPEGRLLLREYKQHYSWKQEGLEFHVKDCSEFTDLKAKFTNLFFDALSALKGAIPLEELQSYLKFYHRAPELQCQDTEEAVHLIQENCSLINIKLLGAVLNKFNVTSVKPAIEEYEKSIEEFCETVPLRKCLDKKFSECSRFSCETITFIIDGDVADYTVGDVKCIINRILSDIAPHVTLAVVRETKSFVITCSFHLIHSHLLISVALDNIAKTDMKEFLQINIGYCTVYDASNINKEKEISIYTCKGALEQLVLSMSVHQNLSTSGCLTENDEQLINVMLEIKELKEALQINERLRRGSTHKIKTLESAKVFSSREKEAKDDSDLSDQELNKKGNEQAERKDIEIELLRDEIKLLQRRLIAKESANEERGGKKIQTLSISHLTEIYNLLQMHSVSAKINYKKLGEYLGVSSNTLQTISQQSPGDDDQCLKECLKAWLEQVDNVRMKGPTTIYSLIHALKRSGNNAIAHEIDKEKHPASAIFNEYASNETIVKEIPNFILTLHNERIVTKIPAKGAEVAEVKESICADHSILEKLASILQRFERTKEVATKMKNDYLGSKRTCGIEIIKIPIALPDLETVRAEYAKIVVSCRKAMSTIKLHELKTYLRNGYPLQLDDSKTEDHALDLICDKCSLVNITPLKKLAQQFSIDKAIKLIQQYDEIIIRFCDKLLGPNKVHCACEASHLQPTTVVVPVDKNIDKRSLDDTRMLALHAFSDKVQVLVIGRDTNY